MNQTLPHPDTPRRLRRVLLLLGAYSRGVHDGVARYAKEHRWTLDLSYVRGGQLKYTLRLDGILGLITNPRDMDVLRQLPQLPLVDTSAAWNRNVLSKQCGAPVGRVISDNAAIGRQAADYFIKRGFQHIALFNLGDYWMEQERRITFRAAVEEAGRTYHELKYYQWQSQESSDQTGFPEDEALLRLEQELKDLPKPVGILVPSDDYGVILLQACEEVGLHVPEELAILGCHNELQICETAPIPLSSVDENLELQGYEAARLLDQMMDGEPPPEAPVIIPLKGIVTRTSTDILAIEHVGVAKALRYIWEHYTEPIKVENVACAAHMSRRSLTRLFQTHLHRSVTTEISTKRIEFAKKLLLESDMKAWQVAEEAGFSSMEHLSKAFTRIVGCPPSIFRHQG